MTPRLFGTDGIRGAAGTFPLDPPTVARIGAALVKARPAGAQPPAIIVGRDTRESGGWIEHALAKGATSLGASVTSVGVAPTPAVAYLAASAGFDLGVVVSASHNPYPDNGIKVFGTDGVKFDDCREDELSRVILDESWSVATESLEMTANPALLDRYLDHLRDVLPDPSPLGPMRLAIDCANGATSRVASHLFRGLGFDVQAIGCEPDGRNINDDCGSTYPERLAQIVTTRRCRMGVAFDGDGDRAIFVDAEGRVVDGDAVLFVCARDLQRQGQLRGNAIVATVMSNVGLEIALRALGIDLARCAVGDKYVVELLRARQLALGGEQSGHVIFPDVLSTGDGLLTTLMVLRAMAAGGRGLGELAADLTVYPQVLVNVRVREKADLQSVPAIAATVRDVEARLEGQGRLLVRYSGTEPLLRIMLEGRDQDAINAWADEIAAVVRSELG